jgi:hypothetical protein
MASAIWNRVYSLVTGELPSSPHDEEKELLSKEESQAPAEEEYENLHKASMKVTGKTKIIQKSAGGERAMPLSPKRASYFGSAPIESPKRTPRKIPTKSQASAYNVIFSKKKQNKDPIRSTNFNNVRNMWEKR